MMMKILSTVGLFIVCFGVIISFQNCSESSEKEPIFQADFTFAPTGAEVGVSVKFTNTTLSTLKNTYSWDFGDGTTSSKENSDHVYKKVGNYLIVFTVTNPNGDFTSSSKELMVSYSNDIDGRVGLRKYLENLNWNILICAHRAYHINSPENSLAAINDAIKEKIAMVEIDIRQTKDGELVLLHDKSLNRTTNGSGNVNELTFQKVKQYNLVHQNKLTSQLIPSLKEVLELAKGKIYIDLDVKIENFLKVYKLIRFYGMVKQVMFTVDDIATAKSLIANDEQTILMPIVRNQSDFDRYTMANLNLSVLHYTSGSLYADLIDQAHSKKLSVFKLVYVNSSTTPDSDSYKQIDNLIELKGNIVQTDYPVEVKTYLQSKNLN